jgi:hypothetical protein
MLKEFFDYFVEFNSEELSNLWIYKKIEITNSCWIEQVCFTDNESLLSFNSSTNHFGLLIPQGAGEKVYNHTRYLVQYLWEWFSEDNESDLKIYLYGQAYQSIIPLKSFYSVEDLYLSGTVERVDRFNNHSERELNKLYAVAFKHAVRG